MVRLQKYISDAGITSRRKAEELINEGRVRVNGKVATLGLKVDENSDVVEVDGKKVLLNDEKIYIILNKPAGYLSSVTDDRGRKTVIDLIDIKERVFPVGRLDYDTEGLLILTNDGEFTYNVTHPKFEINKTYIATLNKLPKKEELDKFYDGVEIEDYIAVAKEVKIYDDLKKEVLITISQGKNRQVRKMFDCLGYNVIKLKRISIGKLTLESLKCGKWKKAGKKELEKIFA